MKGLPAAPAGPRMGGVSQGAITGDMPCFPYAFVGAAAQPRPVESGHL